MNKMICEELFLGAKIGKLTILEIPTQVVSEVADVVYNDKKGIKIEWIDKVLGEIGANRDHYALLQQL